MNHEEKGLAARPPTDSEELRIAVFAAHRACTGLEAERDDSGARIHGYCVVCGIPWPCEVAQAGIDAALGEARGTASASESTKEQGAPEGVSPLTAEEIAQARQEESERWRSRYGDSEDALHKALTLLRWIADNEEEAFDINREAWRDEWPARDTRARLLDEWDKKMVEAKALAARLGVEPGTAPTAPPVETAPPAPDLLRENARLRADLGIAHTMREKHLGNLRACMETRDWLREERDEARDWVRRLTKENVLTCVYCGAAYPPGTPSHGAPVLTEHIKVCHKHPLRAAEEELTRARAAHMENAELLAKAQGLLRDVRPTLDDINGLLGGEGDPEGECVARNAGLLRDRIDLALVDRKGDAAQPPLSPDVAAAAAAPAKEREP